MKTAMIIDTKINLAFSNFLPLSLYLSQAPAQHTIEMWAYLGGGEFGTSGPHVSPSPTFLHLTP